MLYYINILYILYIFILKNVDKKNFTTTNGWNIRY